MRLLLSSGVPWARGDVRGRTPLHLAAGSGSTAQARGAVLAALLERADPGQVDLQDDRKVGTAPHEALEAAPLLGDWTRGSESGSEVMEAHRMLRKQYYIPRVGTSPAILARCRTVVKRVGTLCSALKLI